MKKAVIVTPFDNYSYNVRIKFVEEYLQKKGYNVKIFSSDFDHRNKKKYQNNRKGLELLKVPGYKQNLSLSRIKSHRVFAKKSVKRALQIQPDLLYVSGPPNFLYRYFAVNKKRFKGAKLIFEVGDMWPETLPISSKLKKIAFIPLEYWTLLRNRYIKYGDFIVCECELFKNMLNKYANHNNITTIYMCKESDNQINLKVDSVNTIKLLYLGAINNIIDIELIALFVKSMVANKEIKVHIIGDGEKRNELIKKLSEAGADVEFHGIIYDEYKKERIMEQCHFAFNIMKKTVCVGVTMKSVDYFQYGLPIINNIPYDTAKIVNDFQCGYNVSIESLEEVGKKISALNRNQIQKLKENSRKVYLQYFSKDVFEAQFDDIIRKTEDKQETSYEKK